MQKLQTILALQYLRALAATLVTISHATRAVQSISPHTLRLHLGDSGVSLFFIISGYIMYTLAKTDSQQARSPSYFLLRRYIRIFPIYWIATALALLLMVMTPHLSPATYSTLIKEHLLPINKSFLITSLLLLPNLHTNIQQAAILSVAWTLILEMYFYHVVALSIMTRKIFLTATLIIIGVILLSQTWVTPITLYYSKLTVINFLLGITLAKYPLLYRQKYFIAILLVLGLSGIVINNLSINLNSIPSYFGYPLIIPNFITEGIPWVMVMTALLSYERFYGLSLLSPLKLIGDASYSIYLFHESVLIPIELFLIKAIKLQDYLSGSVLVICVVVATTGIGCIIYQLIEKPIIAYFKALMLSSKQKTSRIQSL